MAGSVNKVILIGHLARDPESRSTNGGSKVVNITVATSERWTDKASGEKKEKAEFHRVVIFNERLSDLAEKYLRKGSHVYIEGSLQTRKWTDQSGAEKYATEIVLGRFNGHMTMLGKAADAEQPAPPPPPAPKPAPPKASTSKAAPASAGAFLDDEIPFAPEWR